MKVNKARKQGGREERRSEGRTEKGNKENGKVKMAERKIRNKDKKKEISYILSRRSSAMTKNCTLIRV
jgi:hypothetical protein